MTSSKKFISIALFIAFAIVGLLGYALLTGNEHPLIGVGGKDGKLGGNFTLQSADGPVSLTDYRGQVVVVYFGFLSCPEVCPTSMGILKKTFKRLSTDGLNNVQGVLISIDPKRDSFEKLKNFSSFYHQNITGVTGTPEQVDQVARDYGAYFKMIEAEEFKQEYAFEHTSRYYVIDQEGRLVDAMRHSTTANELTAKIKTLL
ncbi:SCO family protein [Kangiella sp. HZ709]|uniref:SCO family protein n=1 Tax=Kangiella sp. HZ709 TaxID=2666328 RepID=UPI0012B0216B|nr:SCO family protein [Kangiella sp. HZ709]MRX26831.1 redoxin domain-containing protein [Kangiella sp. HZ709]